MDRPNWEHEVELPVGVPSDGDAPSGQHRTATLRKMTGHEEALLADPRLRSNGAKLVTALLSSCLTSLNGFKPVESRLTRSLYSADRNFLLLELRKLTFGAEIECSYRCPRCGANVRVLEDLEQIEVRAGGEGEGGEITVELTDGYRDSNGDCHQRIVFALPTGEDEEAASGRKDNNASRQRDALLSRCLRKVGTMDTRKVEAAGLRILSELSMADRRLIQRALDEKAPGPNLTREVTCDACGDEFRAALDMTHFFPLA